MNQLSVSQSTGGRRESSPSRERQQKAGMRITWRECPQVWLMIQLKKFDVTPVDKWTGQQRKLDQVSDDVGQEVNKSWFLSWFFYLCTKACSCACAQGANSDQWPPDNSFQELTCNLHTCCGSVQLHKQVNYWTLICNDTWSKDIESHTFDTVTLTLCKGWVFTCIFLYTTSYVVLFRKYLEQLTGLVGDN